MERRFTEFRSAEADGTTAILAIAEDGDPVILSKDWGTLREESEAEWERVVKALMPVAIEGVESSDDPVSVEVTEAVEQIANSGLVDATDSRGNRRARALLEYLIDSRIFECSEDEVVLLESLGIDTESGYTASLVTAAIFEYLQEELNRGIDELAETESELEDTEIVSHVLEEYTLVDAQELEQELAGTVESLASLGDAFAELEAEARQVAAQRQLAGDIDTPHMRTLVEDITSTSLSDMEVDDIDEQLSDLTDSGSNYPL